MAKSREWHDADLQNAYASAWAYVHGLALSLKIHADEFGAEETSKIVDRSCANEAGDIFRYVTELSARGYLRPDTREVTNLDALPPKR